MNKKTWITLRVEETLRKKVEESAKKDRRSLSNTCVLILEKHFENIAEESTKYKKN